MELVGICVNGSINQNYSLTFPMDIFSRIETQQLVLKSAPIIMFLSCKVDILVGMAKVSDTTFESTLGVPLRLVDVR
jgi:hypothetical protein